MFLLRGRHTCMCCIRLINVEHNKHFFAWDNFTLSVFIVELLQLAKFHNA